MNSYYSCAIAARNRKNKTEKAVRQDRQIRISSTVMLICSRQVEEFYWTKKGNCCGHLESTLVDTMGVIVDTCGQYLGEI